MTELPKGYGQRYMTAREFSSFCTASNVNIAPFNEGLELFEKERILVPVARVIKPVEYVTRRKGLDEQGDTYGQLLPEWDDLERLVYVRGVAQAKGEETVWHPFDQEFEYRNPFLARPSPGQFQKWKSYWSNGQAVEHYYHYWQVHQVHAINECYPVFAKHHWILESLKEDVHRVEFLQPMDSEPRLTIGGMTHCYDALSFYIEIHENERIRTFLQVPEVEGIRRLSEDQYDLYRARQATHAQSVAAQYSLTAESLQDFVIELLQMRARYDEQERSKLASVVKSDLRYLWAMITHITGQSFDEISDELGKRGLFWANQFRSLEEDVLMRDCMKKYLARLGESYSLKFPSRPYAESDADDLLQFVFTKDLIILPHAIYSLHSTLNDPERRDVISLYVAMKNLATSFEYFLREIARRSGNTKTKNLVNDSHRNTLRPLTCSLMQGEKWLSLFESSKNLSRASSPDGFTQNILQIMSDPHFSGSEENEIARLFLVAENTRNLTTHFFTLEDRLYGNLRGQLFTAVMYALMYSWQFARHRGWV